MTFCPSEPTSRSKTKMKNFIVGLSDSLGGIDEDFSEELGHEHYISDGEFSSNIEPTSIAPQSLHRNARKNPATTRITNQL